MSLFTATFRTATLVLSLLDSLAHDRTGVIAYSLPFCECLLLDVYPLRFLQRHVDIAFTAIEDGEAVAQKVRTMLDDRTYPILLAKMRNEKQKRNRSND